MISYEDSDYEALMGNIDSETVYTAKVCTSQCTGCMCQCRCSCSGGVVSDVDWEEEF